MIKFTYLTHLDYLLCDNGVILSSHLSYKPMGHVYSRLSDLRETLTSVAGDVVCLWRMSYVSTCKCKSTNLAEMTSQTETWIRMEHLPTRHLSQLYMQVTGRATSTEKMEMRATFPFYPPLDDTADETPAETLNLERWTILRGMCARTCLKPQMKMYHLWEWILVCWRVVKVFLLHSK